MPMFMMMGRYSPDAIKAMMDSGTDREAASKQAVTAAGGKLLGFYGMFGQDYHVALIVDMPGNAEYIGTLATAMMTGAWVAYKTIPLYTSADLAKASAVSKKVRAAYRPPAA
jgi:uncharacterized protein with GYD domain